MENSNTLPTPSSLSTWTVSYTHLMHIFFEGDTDESGIIDGIILPAPARSSSENPFQPHPFTIYDIHVQNPLYLPQDLRYGAIFEGVKSIQPCLLYTSYGSWWRFLRHIW